jgi:hypothetical protein
MKKKVNEGWFGIFEKQKILPFISKQQDECVWLVLYFFQSC